MITRPPEAERNAKIVKLYNTGSYTFSSIARMFNLTRQRVHSIVKRATEQENQETSLDKAQAEANDQEI